MWLNMLIAIVCVVYSRYTVFSYLSLRDIDRKLTLNATGVLGRHKLGSSAEIFIAHAFV